MVSRNDAMKIILIITGLPGAGKTAASSHIRKTGIPVFLTGDVIREEMKKRGMEFNNANSERVAVEVRKEHGMDYPSRKTAEKIEKLDEELVCVDGPRDMYEIRYFARIAMVMIAIIKSPDRVRYQRLVRAGGYKKPKSYEEFLWRANEELKRGMKEVIGTREYEKHVIINDSTKEEMYKKIDILIEEIRKRIK